MAHHYTTTQGKITLDQLTDEKSGIRIQVSRQGAELVSLARRHNDGHWQGFLYRDGDLSTPPTGWSNHATIMGYYLHSLKGGQTTYRDQIIKGGTHGLIRSKEFAPPEVSNDALTYHLTPAEFHDDEYPLQVHFSITYRLVDGKLEVAFDFHNKEPDTIAHVSFGLHPGFAAKSLESCRILLPAGVYTRYLTPGNFLSGETEVIDFPGGEMPFNKSDLEGSFLLELTNVKDPVFKFEDPATRRLVELDFSQVPYVTIWSDGGPFVCIEPCWGMADHARQRKFEEKLGIEKILPGQTLAKNFSIRPELLLG